MYAAAVWLGTLTPRASAESAPVIVSAKTAVTTVNQTFNYQIVLANFATGTYAATGLPAGLALDPKAGVISGAPTIAATSVITLTATNADGTGTSTLTLTVEPAAPPLITSPDVAMVTAGQAFTYQIVASNFPTSYVASSLPAGLSLDAKTGLITGVPASTGRFLLTLSATNVRGTGTASFELTVAPVLPVVSLTTDTAISDPLHGDKARFTLTRMGGDLTQPLTVVFTVKGSALNGSDYQLLPITKTIKAGKTFKHLPIIALNPQAAVGSKKSVKLALQPNDAYQINAAAATAKLKLIFAP